ncbi:xylose isomerase-like protein [Endogone sp. FLAS-F59071]|nr:xylose isomerase-like protein [Endogone sp. FLAS-F59071]|eukprot:RUS16728.1 xylose isomerase-like protein [Endogone sp. FLAS-F59071]
MNFTKLVGAHVSTLGGVHHSISHAHHIGGTALALSLRSQRRWESPALDQAHVQLFKERAVEHGYGAHTVLPHGSYLVNLGNPDKAKREKSYVAFLDELRRCEQLGLKLYNFHPGSTVGACTIEESIEYIATCINRAHEETKQMICVLENMVTEFITIALLDPTLLAGAGHVIGSKFEELGEIISRINRVLESAWIHVIRLQPKNLGYDIRTPEAYRKTMALFANYIGFPFLRGLHLNDSKAPLGSRKDRHENIGKGLIGLEAFRMIMNDQRLNGIPFILETPLGEKNDLRVWKEEVELLYGLVETKEDG